MPRNQEKKVLTKSENDFIRFIEIQWYFEMSLYFFMLLVITLILTSNVNNYWKLCVDNWWIYNINTKKCTE